MLFFVLLCPRWPTLAKVLIQLKRGPMYVGEGENLGVKKGEVLPELELSVNLFGEVGVLLMVLNQKIIIISYLRRWKK